MPGELLLVNPRRRRRRGPRRMSALQRKYFGKGRRRVTSLASNPRRRRRRSRRATTLYANPRRRRSHRRVTRLARNPRRRHRLRLRRNPSLSLSSPMSFVKNTVMPAAIGATGALAVDWAFANLPVPMFLTSGMMLPIARIGGALLVGVAAGAVMGKKFGEDVAAGAVTVTLYDLIKTSMQTNMPNVRLARYVSMRGVPRRIIPAGNRMRLGYRNAARVMGPGLNGMGVRRRRPMMGMAKYVRG